MQRSKGRPYLLAAAAITGLSAISASAAITGFGGFAPVNTSVSSTNIGYSGDGTTFELTDGNGSEATSGFASTPQVISSFVASFTYTAPGGPTSTTQYNQADGFTFIIQDDSRTTAAIGGGGGGKGYDGTTNNAANITPSVALGYEMYGGTTFQYSTNGSTTASPSVGFQIANGDPVQVTVAYNGTALQTGIYDPVSKKSFVATDPGINLAAILGSNTAYIGFGGGTGGAASTQKISNFTFTPTGYLYTPVALASGYNQQMVIPASAPASGAINNITATMDAGTAKTGATYYEQGYNTAAPLTGLPASGSTFTSQADNRHVFTMGNYSAASAVLLSPTATSDTISFANPSAYYALSFLTATGNGVAAFNLTINYADGAPSTFIPYDVVSPDWFFQGPAAYITEGRAYPSTGATTYDNVNNNEPNLYQLDVLMPDTTDQISSITLGYDAAAGNLAIFAVSGAMVPEPASLGLLAAGSLALLARRRRRA